MACYSPLQAYRAPNSKKLEFSPHPDQIEALRVPCGQCIGCRLENSRQKAMRGSLESMMHEQNTWLTLTFEPGAEPSLGNERRELDNFHKRLRNRVGEGMSHLACMEYGDRTGRLHYHSVVFGYDFEDKYPWKRTAEGILYRSPELETIWTKGHALIGEVNFDTIAYTSRYVTKKITGLDAEAHYKGRTPEFLSMSRRPAIGLRFLDKYFTDIYPKDFITVRGRRMKPPIYFDRELEKRDPEMYHQVKERRAKVALKSEPQNWVRGRPQQRAEYYLRKIRQKYDPSSIHRI